MSRNWTALIIVVCFLVGGPRGVMGIEAELSPKRVPRPYLALEPWSGFWPGPQGSSQQVHLDSHTQFARWEQLRKALAERGSQVSREAPSPGLAEGINPPPAMAATDPLYWESEVFREAWAHALELARVGDATGTRETLALHPANTLEGERLARRLVFATAVAGGDRRGADSLYYRLSWQDGGRTATRLKAWEAMEDGDPDRGVSALQSLLDPTWGEDAVLAMARWKQTPRDPGPEPVTGAEAPLLARTALDLARARWAFMQGNGAYALEVWQGIPRASVPVSWQPTYSRLEVLVSGSPESLIEDDVSAYREATRAFMAAKDDEAETALSTWLGAWPVSGLRANAYLMRAHVRTARGDLDAADGDLRAAERLGESEGVADRVMVVRAFILAQRGQGGRAGNTLDSAILSPLGARIEAELRFNATRLARLTQDEQLLQENLLQLEEGFPGEPWAGLARADTQPSRWKAPHRSLPPEPQISSVIPAPTSGPWARLLWGEDFLAREAIALQGQSYQPVWEDPIPGETVDVTPVVVPPMNSRRPMAFADLGIGGPAALIMGGGVAGMVGDLQYRADLAKTLSEGRNELPDYRRTDWEAGLGMRPGDVRLGVTLEGTARTDDDAPVLGLSEDVVEASWWGARGDFGVRSPEESGVRVSGALMKGEVELRHTDRWRTKQSWLSASGGTWIGSARWDGSYTLGVLDYAQPGKSDSPWYHDLRLTRGLPGGWYLGGRGAVYQKRVLLAPVAGFDQDLGSGFKIWAASEPSLALPNFRETFVSNGDWNLPDFSLPAERRYLDLRGGFKWADQDEHSLALGGEVFRTDLLRTWERVGRLWEERAISSDATGFKVIASGATALGPFRVVGKGVAKSVRAEGRQVPYVPRYEGWLELGYDYRGWRWVVTLSGVNGREDEMRGHYGDYLRWDVDVAYRFPNRSLPLGFRNLEVAFGLDNLTDVDDRRWPGVPAYGLGVVAGVRALYGN